MSISSISSYSDIFYGIDSTHNRSRREDNNGTTGSSGRNLGPDTVSISNEAMEKYYSMKNSSSTHGTDNESLQSSYKDKILGNQHGENEAKKYTKMDNSELLAFLKSDSFAEEAMGYVKSVSSESAKSKDGEDSTTDTFIQALENAEKDAQAGNVDNENDVDRQSKNSGGHNGSFMDGELTSEKELSAAISKAEQELKELTATYQQIMSTDVDTDVKSAVAADVNVGTAAGITADVTAKAGEGLGQDEKFRLAQPVYKQLQEKLEELQSLRAQAQGLKEAENKGMLKL